MNCPKCKADLTGKLIPKELQPAYGTTHFERQIGIVDINLDRVVAWKCPDCGHEWKRGKHD